MSTHPPQRFFYPDNPEYSGSISGGLPYLPKNKLPPNMPPFVLSLSKHRQPFDKLRANGSQFWVDYFKESP